MGQSLHGRLVLAGGNVFCVWYPVVHYLVHKSLALNSIFILDLSPQQSCEMKNINWKRRNEV
jgi:hypothetical protein